MRSVRLAPGRRGTLAWAAVATAAILAASLAACSGETAPATTATGPAANSALAAEVEALTKPRQSYTVPTEALTNVASLAGKTVYYIPVTAQSPQFAITQKALTAALTAAGLKIQVCDGKATPTDVSACVNQAVNAKAGAIITDAISYTLAANAFDAAQAAGIPLVNTNQLPNPNKPASKTLAYIPASGAGMQVALAKWVSLDSGGQGRVLINQGTDGPAPAAFVAAGKETYAKDCPSCKISINEISSANFSLIAPSTSAALLKDPNIGYVISQFEQYLQPTQTGVQQTTRTDIKGLTGSVQLSGLKALAGKDFLYAAAGQASAYQGWVDADVAMRLMLGMAAPQYTIPVRLFTRDSIGGVPLTAEAEASGEWYGPTTYTQDFKKLWGVS
jgi:ribose transport system substrate-binding protein